MFLHVMAFTLNLTPCIYHELSMMLDQHELVSFNARHCHVERRVTESLFFHLLNAHSVSQAAIIS